MIVEIEQGKLRGRTAQGIDGKIYKIFQGIPYAKPPVGKLRFLAPQPPEPWTENIWDATKERDVCYAYDMVNNPKQVFGSDDCLYLNVYTPATKITDKLPVMVWVHGGGFYLGSGNTDLYGPEFLMTKNVVLVTFNYRLGFLGFLSLDDASVGVTGNAGLKDQVQALRWVQKNIHKFNGDPNNVTIFGESAGGASCNFLLLSPLSKGLFHKAIIQSGCVLNSWVQQPRLDEIFLKQIGCKATNDKDILEFLQQQPLNVILAAQNKTFPIPTRCMGELCFPTPRVEPNISTAFLSEPSEKLLLEGRFHKVPVMIGVTSHEGLLYLNPEFIESFPPDFTDNKILVPRDLKEILKTEKAIQEVGDKIKQFYYKNEKPSYDLFDTFIDYCSDLAFIHKINVTTKLLGEHASVYAYYCKLNTKLGIIKNATGIEYDGTCHADDVAYLFKTQKTPTIESNSPEAIGVEMMTTLWINFAKTGSPNSKNINVDWKLFTPREENYLEIDIKPQAKKNMLKERMRFWNDLYRTVAVDSTIYQKLRVWCKL
ncbi:esterase B1-like [Chrysoperla carnea]|uniref:esterase B1-like n=1 Tax=Chrysoperla carnea TaxID=189513 RepID=UPI001D08FBD3|nr:esterase B1-like [Chrysoperla carnea]